MVYQCHKCEKKFIQKTDYRRHLDRKVDCRNILLEDRVAEKVIRALKIELSVDNKQMPLVDIINTENWADMKIGQIHSKMNEHKIPMLLYRSGKNKGNVSNNRPATVAHCLKIARTMSIVDAKEPATEEPAIEEPAIEEPIANIVDANNAGNSIVSCVNACHNLMRNRDSIVGEKAMHDIMRLLFVKFLEPMILNGQVDILDSKYYDNIQHYRPGLELNAKFSVFKENTLSDSVKHSKMVWKIILANHPMTKEIFDADDYFNCSQPTLVELLSKIDMGLKNEKFELLKNDVKGRLYEEFLNGYSNNAGKSFGQYFTIRDYIRLIFKQIGQHNTDTFSNLIDENVFIVLDPCMGTAGMLTETYESLKLKGKTSMIEGCEIEAETYTYALMNAILTIGSLAVNNFKRVDSIVCCNPLNKVNFIPTNPPFGTKMEYVDLKNKYNTLYATELKTDNFPKFSDIYPIKTNDGVALFLQMMVFKLAPGGLCVSIVPNGKLLSNKTFSKLRRYIHSMCAVEKIMYAPGGVFKHAGVKTAVLYLRKYTDSEIKEGSLNMIQFVETTKQLDTPISLGSVIVSEENMFSWDFNSYTNQSTPNWGGVEWRAMGELFTLLSTTKHKTSMGNTSGNYRFYNSSQYKKLYLDTYEIKQESIIIGNGGNANIHIDSCFTASKHVTVCVPLEEYKNSTRYIYLYLLHHMVLFEDVSNGSGITWLNKDNIRKIKTPVPPLEVQQRIVKQLDEIQGGGERHRQLLADKKNYMKLYREHAQPPFADHKDDIKWVPLGELCEIAIGGTPSRKNSEYWNGDNIWVSVAELNGNIITDSKEKITNSGVSKSSTKLVKTGSILMSFKLSIGKMGIAGCDLYTNEAIVAINSKEHVSQKYIYHYLSYKQTFNATGAIGTGSLNMGSIAMIKIPVPSLEVQAEFVKFYEAKEQKLKKLQQDIDNTKQYLKWLDDLGRMVIENTIITG